MSTERDNLSRRTRFEVLKRDGFRCVYCGATPQDQPLQVDHVVAVANGGTDDPANLVTACQPCNGGKSAVPLEERRLKSGLTADEAREHAEQIRGYLDAQRQVAAAREEVVEELRARWEELISNGTTPQERGVMRTMLNEFSFADLVGAMEIAAGRFAPCESGYAATSAFKYFCGIVRRWRETGIVSVQIQEGMRMK
jgi:hypothetical protein